MSETENRSYSFKSSIPVIPILDEKIARAFYIDFLEYQEDWAHRFRDDPSSPLYMQIHQGDSVLHLNGHVDKDSPTCQIRIPVDRLEDYCAALVAKDAEYEKPEVVDPRYEGRKTDMSVIDPFGNQLVFWSPAPGE